MGEAVLALMGYFDNILVASGDSRNGDELNGIKLNWKVCSSV
jgi:hypothetical protein